MRPEFEKISEPPQRSFTAKRVIRESRPHLHQAWHYHPEIEICYTYKSNGRRFVGNQIANYAEGDMVLFGKNLPHGFTTPMKCEQIVIQLNHNFLGPDFFSKPELKNIYDLLERGRMGLEIDGKTKKTAIKKINKVMKHTGGKQLIALLDLLLYISDSQDLTPICSKEYAMEFDATQFDRLKQVYDHIILNYQKDISVKEIAQTINLTESAFYKFIRRHTKKTFTEIVNEFRINHASKLLITSQMSVAQVCYNSGYNNLSYFNRKFKELLGQTPKKFRADYQS